MLMVNFNELKIVDIEDFITVDIILDWNPSFLDEPLSVFMKALAQKVESELDKHLFKKPVSFRFITRFDNNDLDIITDNLVNAVINYIVGSKRDRESFLGREKLPEEINNVMMLNASMMDCVNNKLDTDIFNITIFNKNDKDFFSILDMHKKQGVTHYTKE
jgi:hypothetical protein